MAEFIPPEASPAEAAAPSAGDLGVDDIEFVLTPRGLAVGSAPDGTRLLRFEGVARVSVIVPLAGEAEAAVKRGLTGVIIAGAGDMPAGS